MSLVLDLLDMFWLFLSDSRWNLFSISSVLKCLYDVPWCAYFLVNVLINYSVIPLNMGTQIPQFPEIFLHHITNGLLPFLSQFYLPETPIIPIFNLDWSYFLAFFPLHLCPFALPSERSPYLLSSGFFFCSLISFLFIKYRVSSCFNRNNVFSYLSKDIRYGSFKLLICWVTFFFVVVLCLASLWLSGVLSLAFPLRETLVCLCWLL